LSLDKNKEYLYSCKDDMGFPGVQIRDVQEFYIDGKKRIVIDYINIFGAPTFYDSTMGTFSYIDEK